jgi:hypothetical protein
MYEAVKNADVVLIIKNNIGTIVDIKNVDKHTNRRMFYSPKEFYLEVKTCLQIGSGKYYLIFTSDNNEFDVDIYFCSKDKIPWNKCFFLGWYDTPKDAISALEDYSSKH